MKRILGIVLLILFAISMFVLCVCLGSVNIEIGQIFKVLAQALFSNKIDNAVHYSIIINIRLARVIIATLVGASLSIAGCAMQGLLRNPLADGSTLGVSSAASLGAVIAIMFNLNSPLISFSAINIFAIIFSFVFLVLILSIAYKIDNMLNSNTIILMGIVFSMFINAFISILIAFSGNKLTSITFWTLGSLSSANYNNVLLILGVLIVFASVLVLSYKELNALAMGEEKARYLGINTKLVKLKILVSSSALIGTSVSICGNIAFVGLLIPHIARRVYGSNHRSILPMSMYIGAIFLMLCDLISRTIISPIELPIGVITSLIGTFAFIIIFYGSRKFKYD